MTGRKDVQVAAWMTALGMDGMAFLSARDPVERLAMQAVARKAADLQSGDT